MNLSELLKVELFGYFTPGHIGLWVKQNILDDQGYTLI